MPQLEQKYWKGASGALLFIGAGLLKIAVGRPRATIRWCEHEHPSSERTLTLGNCDRSRWLLASEHHERRGFDFWFPRGGSIISGIAQPKTAPRSRSAPAQPTEMPGATLIL